MNTFANEYNFSWDIFSNVSWKMKLWLLLTERLCSASQTLVGGYGTFTPLTNLSVGKWMNKTLSLRSFVCHLDFQFPVTVHQLCLDICFKCLKVTCLRHNLLQVQCKVEFIILNDAVFTATAHSCQTVCSMCWFLRQLLVCLGICVRNEFCSASNFVLCLMG